MQPLAVHPTRPGVLLRRASATDLPALVGLLRDDELGASRETEDLAPYATAFARIDADPAHLLLVVASPDTVLATAQLTFLPGLSRRGGTRAQVESVRVASGERGAGLGRWLLEWIIQEARHHGCVLVQLTSDRTRLDAARFYRKLGFEESHAGLKLLL